MGLPFPILSSDEAAAMVSHGATIGFSGFTSAGAPKEILLGDRGGLRPRGHTPQTLSTAFALHEQYLHTKDMRHTNLVDYFR